VFEYKCPVTLRYWAFLKCSHRHHLSFVCHFLSFQVEILSQPTPCDCRSVLQQLSCPGAFLFHQRVGSEEGVGFHTLRGSVSGCGGGAGTSMSTGWHHQDGVQGYSLDIPFRCCEYRQQRWTEFVIFLYCTCLIFISTSLAGSGFQGCNERGRSHSQWTQEEICRDLNFGWIRHTCCFDKCPLNPLFPILSLVAVWLFRLPRLQWATTSRKHVLCFVDKASLKLSCSYPVCHLIKR